MLFRDFVQAAEHDGKDLIDVLLDEAEDVLIVPEVQRPLCYLSGHTEGTSEKQNNHFIYFLKNLKRVSNINKSKLTTLKTANTKLLNPLVSSLLKV